MKFHTNQLDMPCASDYRAYLCVDVRRYRDASSCRKYKPGWVVPTYDVSVGEGGAVLVARRGGAGAGGGAAAARAPRKGSRWEQWAIAKVERVSPDSAIFHFGRASPTTGEQPQAPGGPSSWHVAMRLRYTKRPGSRKQKKVDRDYTPLSSLSEWAGGANQQQL